nr:reverse transcriptase domain-containing protein [Tanacetum cinerariifolium]
HRLNIHEGCLPVRQKKRGRTPERNKAIYEEVEKLVDAGIMKEVHYHSWLSNPVMVLKPLCISNGIILLLHNVTVLPITENFSISDIFSSGHIISPLNPTSGVVARINWLLTSRRNLLKQCSYMIFEGEPPSTYMRCTKCPPISASMIMGPSIPSSSPKGGKEITNSEEKL